MVEENKQSPKEETKEKVKPSVPKELVLVLVVGFIVVFGLVVPEYLFPVIEDDVEGYVYARVPLDYGESLGINVTDVNVVFAGEGLDWEIERGIDFDQLVNGEKLDNETRFILENYTLYHVHEIDETMFSWAVTIFVGVGGLEDSYMEATSQLINESEVEDYKSLLETGMLTTAGACNLSVNNSTIVWELYFGE